MTRKNTQNIQNIRNIGISAHIDSGKTTLTERILFYGGKIQKMHEVRGKDGVGATMDSTQAERDRGITIQSATTYIHWDDHRLNIIDTPGHVDFTIEVERALRVLDGAVFVLCAVGGVQSQSITVDRQMKRYGVPAVAFINKCDRMGADPLNVCEQLRNKLQHNACMIQYPIGLEAQHRGLVDLVSMKAYYFAGKHGEEVLEDCIPGDLRAACEGAREEMLENLAQWDDQLATLFIEEQEMPEELILKVMSQATIAGQFVPVCLGSALANIGVQPLLDKVCQLLPNPEQKTYQAFSQEEKQESQVELQADPEKALVMLAFKSEEQKFGQLTHCRLYQGTVKRGDVITNSTTSKKHKVGRLFQMHANEMIRIEQAQAGDIVALFGIDCRSGDTFTDGSAKLTMTSMYVPEPVISVAVELGTSKDQDLFSKAIQRFVKEDPTFRVGIDEASGQTLLSGMGELHLEVYLQRLQEEYGVSLDIGHPEVAYRETITQPATFSYTYKIANGGKGHYAKIIGSIEPAEDGEHFHFENNIVGGSIPKEFHSSCEKGFLQELKCGALIGHPITGVRVNLNDGAYHAVDSSDMAFQAAASAAFRETYSKTRPQITEPIMKVVVETPEHFTGAVVSGLNKRRGVIIGSTLQQAFVTVEALVPMAELFGYSTALRSSTQGMAEFTMELDSYKLVPRQIQEELIQKKGDKPAA